MESMIDISEVLLELGLSSSVTDEERAIVATAMSRAEAAVRRFLYYNPAYSSHTEYYPVTNRPGSYQDGVWEVDDANAFIRGDGLAVTDELQLRHIPVRSITNLYVDYDGRSGSKSGSFGTDTEKTEGDDFWLNSDGVDGDGDGICRDGIIRSSGLWPIEAGSIKIVYVAGYTGGELHGTDDVIDASPILETVVYEACRRARRIMALKKQTGPGWVPGVITGERVGDYNYTVDGNSVGQLISGGDLEASSKQRLMDFVNMGWTLEG